MFTPALLFRNFGMPPANNPPNCGADSMAGAGAAPPPPGNLPARPAAKEVKGRVCHPCTYTLQYEAGKD